jgi:hypothetical protein
MTDAAWAPQLRRAGIHRASRQFAPFPFKIDMEFAEVITVHLVQL